MVKVTPSFRIPLYNCLSEEPPKAINLDLNVDPEKHQSLHKLWQITSNSTDSFGTPLQTQRHLNAANADLRRATFLHSAVQDFTGNCTKRKDSIRDPKITREIEKLGKQTEKVYDLLKSKIEESFAIAI